MSEPSYDLTLLEGTYLFAFSRYEAEDWLKAVEWLKAVVERAPNYKDADFLLENAQKQLKLATLYDQGQQILESEDWEAARDWFQEILDIDPDYKNANDLYNKAHKEILYSQAWNQLHNERWNEAIKTLTAIRDLDPYYRDVPLLLEQARQKDILDQEYRGAVKRFEYAQRVEQGSGWQEAVTLWREVVNLLQEIARKEPGYKTVSSRLVSAQGRLEFFDLCQKGEEHFAREEWQEAVACMEQAIALDSRDLDMPDKLAEAREKLYQKIREFYEKGSEHYQRGEWKEAIAHLAKASSIEPDYADLPTKLNEARKKQRRQRIIRIALGILNIVVFTIVIAIFQNQIARVGDDIAKWWREIRAIPTPTVAIPSIERIEVLMNGGQLNLDQLPSLTSGEAVMLEVIVFDTNGKRYTSDDLVCEWSVAPLGDEDVGINTDRCKTLYLFSQEYSSQTVRIHVEGLEQQFEPGDAISMKFDITE